MVPWTLGACIATEIASDQYFTEPRTLCNFETSIFYFYLYTFSKHIDLS